MTGRRGRGARLASHVPPIALALAACLARSASAAAQETPQPGPMPELRGDLIVGHQPAAQLGVGVQFAMGYYARLGVVASAGVRIDDVAPRADGRVDVLARFLLDPFRQTPYGLSLGGGVGIRAEPNDHVRPVLLVALDLEGRRSTTGWTPAVQVALGGGARIGVVARRGLQTAR